MNQQIFVYKDGQQFGPFTPQEAWEAALKGQFNPETDYAWHEGISDWLPLKDVILQVAPPAQPAKDEQVTLSQEQAVVPSKEVASVKPKVVVGILVGMVILIAVGFGAYRSLAATNGSTPKTGDGQSTQGPGTFAGIGMHPAVDGVSENLPDSTIIKNNFSVDDVISGGPAENAGLIKGDRIIQVDDTPLDGKTVAEAVGLLRGKVGTSVKVTVLRNGSPTPLYFTMVRVPITLVADSSSSTDSTTNSSSKSTTQTLTTQDKTQQQSDIDGNWNVNSYIEDNGVNKLDRAFYASIHDGKMSLTEWVAKDTIVKEWEYDGPIIKDSSSTDTANTLTYNAVITLTKFPSTWKVKCVYTKPGADGTGEGLTLIAPALSGGFNMTRTTDSQPTTNDPNQMSMAIPITDQSIAGTYQGVNKRGGDAQLRMGAMPQSDLSQSGSASFDLMIDTNNPQDYIAGTWTRDGNIIRFSLGSGKSASGRINSDGSIDLIGISFRK